MREVSRDGQCTQVISLQSRNWSFAQNTFSHCPIPFLTIQKTFCAIQNTFPSDPKYVFSQFKMPFSHDSEKFVSQQLFSFTIQKPFLQSKLYLFQPHVSQKIEKRRRLEAGLICVKLVNLLKLETHETKGGGHKY